MKFSEFIVKNAVIPDLKSQDRDGVLAELVKSLADAGAIPAALVDELVKDLVKREKGGSTGFGKGVAVPHVKSSKIKKMVGTIGRSAAGVDFNAVDHQPVYSILLVLSPENQAQQHLQAMRFIFDNFHKDTFRKFMRQASAADAIADLLDEADEGK